MGWYSNQAVRCGTGQRDKIKKFFEKLEKVLDKRFLMCYLNKVAADTKRIGCQKTLKKVLDKRDEVWYSNEDPPMRRVPCKLNNVTNEKHQTEQFLKN